MEFFEKIKEFFNKILSYLGSVAGSGPTHSNYSNYSNYYTYRDYDDRDYYNAVGGYTYLENVENEDANLNNEIENNEEIENKEEELAENNEEEQNEEYSSEEFDFEPDFDNDD